MSQKGKSTVLAANRRRRSIWEKRSGAGGEPVSVRGGEGGKAGLSLLVAARPVPYHTYIHTYILCTYSANPITGGKMNSSRSEESSLSAIRRPHLHPSPAFSPKLTRRTKVAKSTVETCQGSFPFATAAVGGLTLVFQPTGIFHRRVVTV